MSVARQDYTIVVEVGRRKISASVQNSLSVCYSVVKHLSHLSPLQSSSDQK